MGAKAGALGDRQVVSIVGNALIGCRILASSRSRDDRCDQQISLVRVPPARHAGEMNLLAINSHVALGHVGNSAAVFALQRSGVEVWPIHTVTLSNHPGYGDFRGRTADATLVR